MPSETYFYNNGSSSWKQAVEAWVYTGGAWHSVNAIWVYSKGQTSTFEWRKVFTNASHDSVAIYDTSVGCDSSGLYSATWTGTNLTGLAAKVEYDVGSGWVVAASGIDASLGSYDGDASGYAGFTSLDDTDFRVTIYDTYDSSNITNSPLTATGPYFC